MDVRLVVPGARPPAGGIGRYVSELRRGFEEMGIRSRLTCFRYLPGASRRSILRAFPIGVEGDSGDGITHLMSIMGASMLLTRRMRQSVVTAHDLGALLFDEDRAITNAVDRLVFRVSLWGMRRAGRIITVSDFTRRCLVEHLGFRPDRVDTVPHGIDHETFRPIPDARARLRAQLGLSLEPGTHVVAFTGNEFPRKNLATLAEALTRLNADGRPLLWLKVGRPGNAPSRARFEQILSNSGMRNETIILDDVSDADLAMLYSAADVYVQPSVWEGFGLPVIEAMACGTPVVASRAASLPEVTGSAGLLVDPRDAGVLAAAIRRVLDEPDLAAHLSERGLARARHFSWRRTAERTIESYQSLSQGAPSTHTRLEKPMDGVSVE